MGMARLTRYGWSRPCVCFGPLLPWSWCLSFQDRPQGDSSGHCARGRPVPGLPRRQPPGTRPHPGEYVGALALSRSLPWLCSWCCIRCSRGMARLHRAIAVRLAAAQSAGDRGFQVVTGAHRRVLLVLTLPWMHYFCFFFFCDRPQSLRSPFRSSPLPPQKTRPFWAT